MGGVNENASERTFLSSAWQERGTVSMALTLYGSNLGRSLLFLPLQVIVSGRVVMEIRLRWIVVAAWVLMVADAALVRQALSRFLIYIICEAILPFALRACAFWAWAIGLKYVFVICHNYSVFLRDFVLLSYRTPICANKTIIQYILSRRALCGIMNYC